MNAAQLLATVASRGATARAEIGDDGAAVLVVAPRSAIGDLLLDLQRLKPDLLALLAPDDAPAHRWASATGDDPTGPASAAATPTAPDESPEAAAAMPDARALAVAVEGARRGAHLCPTPELLALWRALSAFVGVPLTSRHTGAAARLVAQHPQLDNTELLDLFGAGLMPDEGDGAPVWIEPETLFDAMHAAAKARANQNEVAT